ncbi:NADH-quinone oxidoreductase subunit C [Rhizobium leguminosarum]|jgi:NADH-quinone oxidoreductase subunit C|uniref:NADH-quinone oxidoreductase subunit C n=1 Tax=Rhizobium leguminosarum TaxID=384 RepID=A0A2Z4YFL2_RHILE|nr:MULTISPECIES: NADH-quinone oxidoreductase subunit C [Rhizobium]AXA40104.1 NADH (or F420H2) dehydrogenase, subunit C family protein [Rhizobium leguminosarum]MBY5905316.1 NADH-quinone oxidoreductase subunit C [Rhizobium leguminosarum]MBY5912407.1 NADH-quinone oxidoreductase subunit C [Rhizobium leguminosarum]MCJ9694168.1 NADH-quinone oxidoreductase subunit C [Rhizobium sp. PRIMUS64]NKK03572.1 NADH-quinone oxidoreductase subunit C [Rhizobium leguminosarum bv. viciae]
MSVETPLIRTTITERFGEAIDDLGFAHGVYAFAAPPDMIVELCRFLKEHPALRFNFLSDICGVDHYPEMPRYETVYHLYSLPNKLRVRIKCRLADPPRVPSVTGIWRTANWHEREAWDMYGIRFEGHPDLRRIYMWEGFEGFPQRKDFPLRGYKDKLNPFGAEGTPPTQPDLATKNIP